MRKLLKADLLCFGATACVAAGAASNLVYPAEPAVLSLPQLRSGV